MLLPTAAKHRQAGPHLRRIGHPLARDMRPGPRVVGYGEDFVEITWFRNIENHGSGPLCAVRSFGIHDFHSVRGRTAIIRAARNLVVSVRKIDDPLDNGMTPRIAPGRGQWNPAIRILEASETPEPPGGVERRWLHAYR